MTRFARILLASAVAGAFAATAAPALARSKKSDAPETRSLDQRHAACLAFIKRHGLSCDPWVEPTCGADTGFFRPLECVRPRSQPR